MLALMSSCRTACPAWYVRHSIEYQLSHLFNTGKKSRDTQAKGQEILLNKHPISAEKKKLHPGSRIMFWKRYAKL